jgi:SEC-C motif
MARRINVNPNDPCPCWSGKKFKRCCRGLVDWEQILRSNQDYRHLMSIRGRNLLFAAAISEALEVDPGAEALSLSTYKKAFTPRAVRKIYEAIVEIWPSDTNVQSLLERTRTDVSGIFIGDYHPSYVSRALVRHSIYANKILLIEPFPHPYIMRDEYNPILNSEQYRAQTLKGVNFYMSVMPWVEAGIVEFVRTPADFNRQLNFDAMRRAQTLGDKPEIRAALTATVEDLKSRHFKSEALHMLLLGAPDSHIRRMFRKLSLGDSKFTEDDFIDYINSLRDSNPDFLEPMTAGANNAQLHMIFSGGTYEMASLTAQMAGSYLFTDLQAKWAMIENAWKQNSAETEVWSPFAKAVQNAKLHYLNNLSLGHALKLRTEGRLENLRSFLTRVWEKVRGDEPFNERAAIHLANDLTAAVDEADSEWNQIKKDLVKIVGSSLSAGAISAGPTIAAGHALWLAAAGVVGTASLALWSKFQKKAYLKKHPAAFFMDLRDD